MTCILAATETVTSQEWWRQVISIVVTAGSLAAAVWAFLRFVPGVRSLWAGWQKRRHLARLAVMKAVVTEAVEPIERRINDSERLSTVRHHQNQSEIQEIGRRVGLVAASQKQIHLRIDRHMDEEREERQADRAELLGWLNMVGALRREDVQAIRSRHVDGPSDESFEDVRGEIPPG